MSTASSAGHGESEAWLPLVVDCGVCETTHALAVGDRRACPFEGSERASLARGGDRTVALLEGRAARVGRVRDRVVR